MDALYTGNMIAARRKELGFTQKELAERLHVTDKAVSKWERGINFPDIALLDKIAAELQFSVIDLLGIENESQELIVASMTDLAKSEKELIERQKIQLEKERQRKLEQQRKEQHALDLLLQKQLEEEIQKVKTTGQQQFFHFINPCQYFLFGIVNQRMAKSPTMIVCIVKSD